MFRLLNDKGCPKNNLFICQIVVDKGDAENDQSETHHLFRHHRHKWETSSCINET